MLFHPGGAGFGAFLIPRMRIYPFTAIRAVISSKFFMGAAESVTFGRIAHPTHRDGICPSNPQPTEPATRRGKPSADMEPAISASDYPCDGLRRTEGRGICRSGADDAAGPRRAQKVIARMYVFAAPGPLESLRRSGWMYSAPAALGMVPVLSRRERCTPANRPRNGQAPAAA